MTGETRVTRAQIDASTDRGNAPPNERRDHHFLYERHNKPGDVLPFLALAMAELLALIFMAGMHR